MNNNNIFNNTKSSSTSRKSSSSSTTRKLLLLLQGHQFCNCEIITRKRSPKTNTSSTLSYSNIKNCNCLFMNTTTSNTTPAEEEEEGNDNSYSSNSNIDNNNNNNNNIKTNRKGNINSFSISKKRFVTVTFVPITVTGFVFIVIIALFFLYKNLVTVLFNNQSIGKVLLTTNTISASTTTMISTNYYDDRINCTIQYRMIEESFLTNANRGVMYQKYGAFLVRNNTITSNDTKQEQQHRQQDQKEHEEVRITIRQWIERILLTTLETETETETVPPPPTTTTSTTIDYSIIDDFINVLYNVPYEAYFFEMPPITTQTLLLQDDYDNIDGTNHNHNNNNNKQSQQSQSQLFEFVVVNAPELHLKVQQDTSSSNNNNNNYVYNSIFRTSSEKSSYNYNQYASVFPNLGHDAVLIVPKPINDDVTSTTTTNNSINMYNTTTTPIKFGHLASFIRSASIEQKRTILQMVVLAYVQQLHLQPKYSTNTTKTLSSTSTSSSVLSLVREQSYKIDTNPDPIIWLSTSGLGISWLHFRLDTYPKYYSYKPYKKT